MTRLFYGSTVLTGLFAMTLLVGCGGSSTPKVTCEGGVCSDAKKDTSGDAGARAEVAVTPDGPAVTPDGPAVTSDRPAVTPDSPAVTPDSPAVTPDGPAVTSDRPAVTPDSPAVTPDGPTVTPDGPTVTPDGPTVTPDVRPTDVTPPDAAVPTDAARDTTPGDGGSDAGLDAPAVTDLPADSPVDAPAPDAAADGGAGDVGDGGGCEGDACHDYTFEGDNPDAGLPAGFVTTAPATVWNVVATSGGDKVLEGVETAGGIEYIETTGGPWADQTIEVTVRFVDVTAPNGIVRICGRANADLTNAYCLYVTSGAGDAGAASGSIAIWKRTGGGSVQRGTTASGLDILVGTWHTYRLSIGGTGTVTLQAFLDGVAVNTGTSTDTAGTYADGQVALGVREVTAEFDNLIVSSP